MAGKPYTVAKRWAVEKGLGFGQLPLFQDKDVIAAWGKWADVQGARRPGGDRQGRHLHRVQLGLVGLFPAAARQGDGRRGAGRSGHEGRRRALEPAQGAVRQPLDCRPERRAASRPSAACLPISSRRRSDVDHQRFPGALAASGAAARRADDGLSRSRMRCGPACTR